MILCAYCFRCLWFTCPVVVPIGAVAYSNAYFGDGSGAIFLDNVACTGNELFLLSCVSLPIGTHNCGHYEDAGVACRGQQAISICNCTHVNLWLCHNEHKQLSQTAQMVTLDWSMVELEMKEGLKSVLMVTGELFVTMAGMIPTRL